jgi:hypothetical protein
LRRNPQRMDRPARSEPQASGVHKAAAARKKSATTDPPTTSLDPKPPQGLDGVHGPSALKNARRSGDGSGARLTASGRGPYLSAMSIRSPSARGLAAVRKARRSAAGWALLAVLALGFAASAGSAVASQMGCCCAEMAASRGRSAPCEPHASLAATGCCKASVALEAAGATAPPAPPATALLATPPSLATSSFASASPCPSLDQVALATTVLRL